jgi:hypothetical protein
MPYTLFLVTLGTIIGIGVGVVFYFYRKQLDWGNSAKRDSFAVGSYAFALILAAGYGLGLDT